MSVPTEDVVLYSIIAFIVIENFIEIYLSRRQVSHFCSVVERREKNTHWNEFIFLRKNRIIILRTNQTSSI